MYRAQVIPDSAAARGNVMLVSHYCKHTKEREKMCCGSIHSKLVIFRLNHHKIVSIIKPNLVVSLSWHVPIQMSVCDIGTDHSECVSAICNSMVSSRELEKRWVWDGGRSWRCFRCSCILSAQYHVFNCI